MALAALITLTGGCAANSPAPAPGVTELRPLGSGAYRYESLADASFPEGDAEAEATRLRWLERRLADQGTCPEGYDVTERRPVVVRQAVLGPVHRIEYTVVCRGEGAVR